MNRGDDPRQAPGGVPTNLAGWRALVVDGDETSRQGLGELLRTLGLEPTLLAEIGAVPDELDRAESARRPFSLLLYDASLRGSAALPARRADDDARLRGLVRIELAPSQKDRAERPGESAPRLRRPVTRESLLAALDLALGGGSLPGGGTGAPGEAGAYRSVLDRALLVSLLGGDALLARTVLERFAEVADASLREIEQAAQTGDGRLLRERAHRLKGGLSWICAERAAETAAEIEALCRAGQVDEAGALCARLRGETEQVVALIHSTRRA